MNRIVLFLFMAMSFSFAKTQNFYPLHPSIGDTIDLNEKLDYSLFDSVPNANYKYGVIEFYNNNFYLRVESQDNSNINLETGLEIENYSSEKLLLTQEKIISEQMKIEKVNAYFKYVAEEAKKPKKDPRISVSKPPSLRIEGPMSDQMKKEVRITSRLKEEQRRSRDFEMGLRPRNAFIEFR